MSILNHKWFQEQAQCSSFATYLVPESGSGAQREMNALSCSYTEQESRGRQSVARMERGAIKTCPGQWTAPNITGASRAADVEAGFQAEV